MRRREEEEENDEQYKFEETVETKYGPGFRDISFQTRSGTLNLNGVGIVGRVLLDQNFNRIQTDDYVELEDRTICC